MSGQTTLGDTMRREAEISPCGLHRYRLTREWAPTLPTIAFVMLNPSTADGEIDDPTIRRCIGFARDLGYGRLHVVNLFTYRATDPRELPEALGAGIRLNGPLADDHLVKLTYNVAASGGLVIAAWGVGLPSLATRMNQQIARIVPAMACLGTTKHGAPRHPLYPSRTARPVAWEPP